MYLRQPLPLPVNSSPGMIVHRNNSRSKSENTAYIAEIIKLILKYKSHVENNELNEQSTGQLAGSHLCMNQYKNIFRKYRRPDKHRDIQITRSSSYFMILSNGIFYRPVQDDIESQIHWILSEKSQPDKTPLFTTCDRREWSRYYNLLRKGRPLSFRVGTSRVTSSVLRRRNKCLSEQNKDLFNEIEGAAFLICLDKNENYEIDVEQFLHGGKMNYYNRWYDSTLQFIINDRGDFGLSYEHSVCEGIPIVNMAQQIKKTLKNFKTKDRYYFGMTPVSSRNFKLSSELTSALLVAEHNILNLQSNLGQVQ